VKCDTCNLVAIDPKPKLEEMTIRSEYWAEKHHKQDVKVNQHFSEEFQQVIFSRYFRLMNSYFLTGRVLDIGCGIGSFMYAAKKNGWQAFGVDIGPAISIAKEHNLSVVKGRLQEASFPENYFDVVSMFDVIEHICDLNQLMATIRKNLRKDGLLLIKTPNLGALTAKLLKQNWSALQPLDHLVLFSSKTIKSYLKNNGFAVLHSESLDFNFFEILDTKRKNNNIDKESNLKSSKRELINRIINNKSLQISRNMLNIVLNLFDLGESLVVWAENRYDDYNIPCKLK